MIIITFLVYSFDNLDVYYTLFLKSVLVPNTSSTPYEGVCNTTPSYYTTLYNIDSNHYIMTIF